MRKEELIQFKGVKIKSRSGRKRRTEEKSSAVSYVEEASYQKKRGESVKREGSIIAAHCAKYIIL